MKRNVCIALLVFVGLLLRTTLAADRPTDEAAYVIPEIPLERIEFRGTGYPIIPPDVQELINQREDVWQRMSQDALTLAMPEIERWEKLGKPFVRVARQPSDLPQVGGRGGKVFVVTTLADHGPGSLREACEAGGPRIVVFNVAGIIQLDRPLDILAPYITIAGQTAPGDGVCIAGHSVHIRTHDVVIRYTRFRRGITDISNRDDTLSGDAIGNIIIDHCSTSWGNDETLSIYRQMYAKDPAKPREREKLATVNNTIQWTIISESLDTFHHGFGATWGGANAGFHHNLFACNTGRNPSISSRDFTFANNVLFNWRHRTLDGGARSVNVINNYFKPGPKTEGALRYRVGKPEGGAWYAAGNVVDGNEAVSKDNWAGGIQHDSDQSGVRGTRLSEPGPMPHMTIQPAADAYAAVLEHSGATLPKRDPVDTRVVEMVRSGTVTYAEGKGIITDIRQVGGYPKYAGDPVKYPQNDGIPDAWKAKYKLDTNDAELAAKDADGDGYTTIEEYLNGTDPTQNVDYTDLKNNANPLMAAGAAALLRQVDATAATAPADARAKSDADQEKKAGEWVASLKLNDPAKAARVQAIIVTHLKAIRDWHNDHPFTTVPAGINPVTGRPLNQLDRQVIANSAIDKSVHDNLMAGLRKDLSEEQVDAILDRYTVGKVAFTMNGYRAIVPDLTLAEEAKILALLKQAREQAVDYKNMNQISAIFEIYNTQAEQYLNSNGRDWKKMYKAYTDAVKARKAATTKPSTQAAG